MADLKLANLGTPVKPVVNVQKDEKNEGGTKPAESSSNNTKKVVLAGLAAAGVIGVALLMIKNHKPSEITIEKFKEAGNKFVKGKAVDSKGKPFSGTIEKMNKDGKKYVMEYADGVLQKVDEKQKMLNGEYLNLSSKKYVYDEAGKLNAVENKHLAIDGSNMTENIFLDLKRSEGMTKFTEKKAKIEAEKVAKIEAEAAEKLELQKKMEPTLKELARTERNIDAAYIEEHFNDYKGPGELNSDFRRLTRQYKELEQGAENEVIKSANKYNTGYAEMMRENKGNDAAYWLAKAAEYVEECPEGYFQRVNKTVKCGDETIQLIYEGIGVDITAEGKLLKKVLVKADDLTNVKYENLTDAKIKATAEARGRTAEQVSQPKPKQKERQKALA